MINNMIITDNDDNHVDNNSDNKNNGDNDILRMMMIWLLKAIIC